MRDHQYRWEWDLQASPEQLWPLVADTNRFDRDAGVPGVAPLDGGVPLANGRTRLRVRQYGVPLDYVQEPFEWDEPHRFSVTRRFTTGPLSQLRAEAELTPNGRGGTKLVYRVRARPRHWIFALAIPIQVGIVLARTFDRTFRGYDRIASIGDLSVRTGGSPDLGRGAESRLAAQSLELRAVGVRPDLTDRIIELVRSGDDVVVGRIQPFALAASWGERRADVLEAFLLATRSGLFRFRWDLLCPLCRVAKSTADTLTDLATDVHCDTCNVDYGPDFAESVELTFSPNPSIREVGLVEYCVGGPAATPHVVCQRLLAPGQAVTIGPLGVIGRYRLRLFQQPGGRYVRVVAPDELDQPDQPDRHDDVDAPSRAPVAHRELATSTVSGGGESTPAARPLVSGGRITVRNDGTEEGLVILERTAMGDHAVTAAHVTGLQRFRDLFASEALRPGEQVSVGSVAIAFTDLVDSTRLYRQIGDAVAFGRVLEHFDVLRACIAAEEGGIVKTIGDAVMAVFPTPVAALRAMVAANEQVTAASAHEAHPLRLKIGIHYGPCIGVTLNDKLDYFGSTVNLAARLQGKAGPGEIVVSSQVHDDPDVSDAIAAPGSSLVFRPSTASLKGFEAEVAVFALES